MPDTWTVSRIPLLVYVTGILMREGVDHDYVWEVTDSGDVQLRFHRALLRNDFVTVVDLRNQTTFIYDTYHASGVYRTTAAFSSQWASTLSRPINKAVVPV